MPPKSACDTKNEKYFLMFPMTKDYHLRRFKKIKDYCALLYDRLKGVFQQNYADLCPKKLLSPLLYYLLYVVLYELKTKKGAG